MSSNIQRRRSIEPGVAFAWAQSDRSAPPSPSRDPQQLAERRVCSHAGDSASHPGLQDERPQGGPLSSLNLKSDYVVPPMSSVSVDPPIPAETDSRSAQDQHPMRANLPLLSQPLLSNGAPSQAQQRLQVLSAPGHATCAYSGLITADASGSSTSCVSNVTADDTGGPTLLTLPPEIRRMIYQHIPYITNRQPLIYCLSIFKDRKQHPLAAICRLVRSESLELYYSSNTWLIKLEYRDFYDSFVSWISSLDDASANALRLLRVSVRGALFAKSMIYGPDGYLVKNTDKGAYGYATFSVELSEKFKFGKVEVLSCDGPTSAGLEGKVALEAIIKGLWEKKSRGQVRGSDIKEAMDTFLSFTGWWL
ncbi:hypothetical protein UCRNP2_9739 [Neofusicoccum parvum UCRNP2]|uniref:F-box domain-containing protein n=2 Tax=Neofusicoccum parvum TaxID=310453 RepID=R1E787_BOTPV|nr:hypothetical protein UCRNP2_9739 [Neofusicoccum parvum UCRNP2]GME27242.1 hypothetical protein BKCO1_1000218 [Neofusicoccum parvum]